MSHRINIRIERNTYLEFINELGGELLTLSQNFSVHGLTFSNEIVYCLAASRKRREEVAGPDDFTSSLRTLGSLSSCSRNLASSRRRSLAASRSRSLASSFTGGLACRGGSAGGRVSSTGSSTSSSCASSSGIGW